MKQSVYIIGGVSLLLVLSILLASASWADVDATKRRLINNLTNIGPINGSVASDINNNGTEEWIYAHNSSASNLSIYYTNGGGIEGVYDSANSEVFWFETLPAIQTSTAAAPSDLILYLPLDNSETDAIDFANGFNATKNASKGIVTSTPGKLGNSYYFAGNASTYMRIADQDNLDLTTAGTLAAWIKTNNTVDDWSQIIRKGRWTGGDVSDYSYVLGLDNGDHARIYLSDGSNADVHPGNKVVADNTWHHLLFTWNSTNMTLYVDGAQDIGKARVRTPASTDEPVWISHYNFDGQWYSGRLDDIRVYSSWSSPSQVAAIYGFGASLATSEDYFSPRAYVVNFTGWLDINSTITDSSTTVNWTTNKESMNCTLNFNGTIYHVNATTTSTGLSESSKVILTSSSRHNHGNSMVKADNGDFLLFYQNTTTHNSGDGDLRYARSTDNGKTWTIEGVVFDESAENDSVIPFAGVAPNGDVIAGSRMFAGGVHQGLKYAISSDDGATWGTPLWMNPSDPDRVQYISSKIRTKGSIMYAPVYNDSPSTNFELWTSSDNGVTWAFNSTVYTTGDTGDDPNYASIYWLDNGTMIYLMHQNTNLSNLMRMSKDDGETWSTLQWVSVSKNSTRDPDIDRLGELYVMHGRDAGSSSADSHDHFGYYLSTDGITWTNYTYVEVTTTITAMSYSTGANIDGDSLILAYSSNSQGSSGPDLTIFQLNRTNATTLLPANNYNQSISGLSNGNFSSITVSCLSSDSVTNSTYAAWLVNTLSSPPMGSLTARWDDWDGKNASTAYNSTTITWYTDSIANCTLAFDGVVYTDVTTFCWQNNSNSTESCSSGTGNYSEHDTNTNIANFIDNDYDTGVQRDGSSLIFGEDYTFFFNYSKITGFSAAILEVKDIAKVNLTTPASCTSQPTLQYKVRMTGVAGVPQYLSYAAWSCRNSTGWQTMRNVTRAGETITIYEEGMYWQFPSNDYNGTQFQRSFSNLANGNYTLNATCEDHTGLLDSTSTAWWNISLSTIEVSWLSWAGQNSTINSTQFKANWTTGTDADNCSLSVGSKTYGNIFYFKNSSGSFTCSGDECNIFGGGSNSTVVDLPRPANANRTKTKFNVGDESFTFPADCWAQNPIQVHLQGCDDFCSGGAILYCENATANKSLGASVPSSNYTIYWANETLFGFNLTERQRGNKTLSVTCYDSLINGTSSNSWIYLNTTDFVSPTPTNGSSSGGENWIEVNVTAQFEFNRSILQWNNTNISMSDGYLNYTESTNGTYTYKVWLKSSIDGSWYTSEIYQYTIATDLGDTAPPKITYVYPENNTNYGSASSFKEFTFRFFTSEPVDFCGYSLNSDRDISQMTSLTRLNQILPALNSQLETELGPPDSEWCWYVRCNDTEGNAMTDGFETCLSVAAQSEQGGGDTGGGAPPEVIVIAPQFFEVLPKHFDPRRCPQGDKCATIPFRVSGSAIDSYEVCNRANSSINITIDFIGYNTTVGGRTVNTADFMSVENEDSIVFPLNISECRTIYITSSYPNLANGTQSFFYSNKTNMTQDFFIRFSSRSTAQLVPIYISPPSGLFDIDFGNLSFADQWLIYAAIILIVILFFMIAYKRKRG
jgi:hypothetical protein